MANMQERLDAAVDKAEVDTGLLHTIVHGSITTEVTTEGGKVSSVAKAIKDIQNAIHSATSDLVAQAQEAAQESTEQAHMSNISAIQASESVNTCREVIKEAQKWVSGTDEEVSALGGIHSAQGWIELAREKTKGCYPTSVSGIATENQTLLPLPETICSLDQIMSVNIENVSLMPDTYALSNDGQSLELTYPLSKDERWNIKFLNDFQTISGVLDAVLYEDM